MRSHPFTGSVDAAIAGCACLVGWLQQAASWYIEKAVLVLVVVIVEATKASYRANADVWSSE